MKIFSPRFFSAVETHGNIGLVKISLGFVHKMLWKNKKKTFFNQSNIMFTVVVQLLSCSTLWDIVGLSPPGSSVHGISHARILEWIVISPSRGSSRTRDWTFISCIGRWILHHWVIGEAHNIMSNQSKAICLLFHGTIVFTSSLPLNLLLTPLGILETIKYQVFVLAFLVTVNIYRVIIMFYTLC